MKKMMNSLAGYATALVLAIFAMASVLVFNSCETGLDDVTVKTDPCPDCPDPNPDPDPEVTVKEVDHYGCELSGFAWSFENAAETRNSEYSVELADGGAFCNSNFKYLADIIYTDGTSQKADEEYSNRSAFVGFGYKNTLYVAAGEAATFENAPEITSQNTSNGVVTFLSWEKKTVAVLANTTNEVKSLTIGGKTMTDLCLPEVAYEYTSSELNKISEDDEFINYELTIFGKAEVYYTTAETKNFHFVLPIKETKGGSVNPPVEDNPEVVDYDIINEKVDDNGNYSGDLEELLSDGSTTIVGTISFSYSYSFDAEENKTVKVNELSYTKKSASYGKNIRTGENRSFEQLGCVINLIGMKNTVSMVTNRGSRLFSGFWEYPVITLPNGKELELLHNTAEMTEGSISDNGISGDQLVINLTATGKYGSKTQDLASTITLVKVDDGEIGGGDEDFQTGAYAKDQRVEGSVIKWTLVRTFNKKADTETAMSIAHKYAMSLDSRKSTENRVYNAGTPALNETSRVNSTDGNYSFDFCSYASTWNYLDFSHAAKAEGRRNIVYHDGEFDVPVWDAALNIERNGVTLGTSNISTSDEKETYLDLINYALFAGDASVSAKSQEVEYSKKIEQSTDEDAVYYNVEKIGVKGDKLYYNEIERHTINTEQNKTVEKSVNLVYSLTAVATEDWTTTANATGILLSTYSQNYTTAKDYIFGSNRGNNIAKASLQTSYTVTYMGKEYTLTVTGAVQASVNLVSSTSSKNTYAFNAKLLADGQEIASDSDNCIETIEEEEIPDQDVVTYNVKKTGVRGNKLYYNEIETHSVNTNENKTVEKSVNLVYSLTAVATADWTTTANATGILLSTYAQNYTTAKDYIFGSNRGNNIAKASLQTSYTVTYMGKSYTLTVTGAVQASVNLVSSTSSKNTYSFNAILLADGQEIASDSDNCVETIEQEETPEKDVVTYDVEKIGVRGNKLYFNKIENHSVNTELNKVTEDYVNLVYSLNATAVADWTAEEGATGITLTNSQLNYNGAKDYVFNSNRGSNKATASLQTTYVVSYGGKNHNLTINGTVTGAISRTSSTSSSNTYSFTARLFADGVEIANDSDDCVETIEASEPDEPTQNIGAVAYYSAVTFTATGTPYVTFATVYDNGNCIVKKANNVEVARGTNPGGTVTEMGGVPVKIVDNNTVYYYYRADGSAIGAVPMSEITIKGYPSGILSVKETVNADGTVTLSNEYGSATFGAY